LYPSRKGAFQIEQKNSSKDLLGRENKVKILNVLKCC